MNSKIKTTLLATAFVAGLSACQNKTEDKAPSAGLVVEVMDTKGDHPTVNVTKDTQAVTDAKGLADAGEQLVGPYTFMLADKVFDTALAADPGNKKAQFYKSFLKRWMVFKGVLTRVRPIVRKRGDIASLEKNISLFPDSPAKEFLMDGTEDIRTSSDVQNLLSAYNEGLNDFRKFAKMNSDLELTLNLNPYVFEKQIRDEAQENCVYVPTPDRSSVVVHCDYTKAAQKKVNAADLIALGQITSGEMLMWSMYTAYDASTIEALSDDENFKLQSPEQKLQTLKSLPSIANLRADHTLKLIPELGADFSAAAKWAMEYQNRLCPRGSGVTNNRRGYLFKNGLCVTRTNDTDRALAMLDAAVTGAIKIPVTDENHQQQGEVTVDFVKFLTQPPQDLRMILPNRVNAEGEVTEQGPDKTLGGLFPNGDAEVISKK